MITLERAAWQNKLHNAEFHGLSTDTKPVEYVDGRPLDNGSVFYEIDTGDTYRFDKANGVWLFQSGSGGDIVVNELDAVANGTYTAPTGTAYSPVIVAIPEWQGGSY